MKKSEKIWLITAASLLLLGFIIFGGVMAMLKWDFTKLSTNKYDTNNYEINEDFNSILIKTNTADITLVPSEDTTSSVECRELKKVNHSVKVVDGTLTIEVVDTRKWYEHIGINFGTSKITVSIPKGDYGALSITSDTGDVEISKNFSFDSVNISEHTGDVKNYASVLKSLKIKTTTGNIRVEGISAGSLDLSVSTGRVEALDVACLGDVSVGVSTGKAFLENLTCKSLFSRGDTGDISLSNVIAEERFSIQRDTGDVKFERCDADEIFVTTDTGDVTGSLLTDKVFIARTDTGRVNVPKTVTGGRCEITTDTGDIKINVIGN